jgi:hypothetical protein
LQNYLSLNFSPKRKILSMTFTRFTPDVAT